MNFKSTICVDTLRVMYQPKELNLNDYNYFQENNCLITIGKQKNHKTLSNSYTHIFKVSITDINNNFAVGFLSYGDKYKIDLINFNFLKTFLYKKNYTNYINIIETCLGLKLNNISRLDIAVDTNRDIVKRVFRLAKNNKYYFMSLRKELNQFVGAYTYSKQSQSFNNSIYIVSNAKTLCIYDKTTQIDQKWYKNELKEDCVSEYHNKIFGSNTAITRVEVRLYNSALTKYTKSKYNDEETRKTQLNIYLTQLENQNYLYTIFERNFNSLLSVREKDNYYKNNKKWLSKKIAIMNMKFNKQNITSSTTSIEKQNRDMSKLKTAIDNQLNGILDFNETTKYLIKLIQDNGLEQEYYEELRILILLTNR